MLKVVYRLTEIDKDSKKERLLDLYTRLLRGEVLQKEKEASHYGVTERSIQRDLHDIIAFCKHQKEHEHYMGLRYNRKKCSFQLEVESESCFTSEEILALCKVLLGSKAFIKEEISNLLNKLLNGCVNADDKKMINHLIKNELYHYIEPKHKKNILSMLWRIGKAIQCNRYITIVYNNKYRQSVVTRNLKPLAILFSEYYFYLIAIVQDDEHNLKRNTNWNYSSPIVYRIDRIQSLNISSKRFVISYSQRFEEGIFRRRSPFMYGGKLQCIVFTYAGYDIDAILDRLPTAEVISYQNGVYTVQATVYGNGIDIWLQGQGKLVQIVKKEEIDDK